jgi:DNA-binding NarL/FixJ family response regulator
MAPSIRYATTSDGASISFATVGEGLPVVFMPPAPFSHLEAMWAAPGQQQWFDRLSRHAQVAIYDSRGTGLSDRGVAAFGLTEMMRDLEAVTQRLGWRTFALCGFFNAAPVAIAYAAAHPEAVTELVLWGGFARGAEIYPMPLPADPQLAATFWPVILDSIARAWTASAGDEASQTVEYFRACVTPDVALAALTSIRGYDVTESLAEVQAPTLVLHRRDAAGQRIEVAQYLASHMPRAELVVLAGDAPSPFAGDIDAGVDAIARFLGVADAPETSEVPAATAVSAEGALTARETEVLRLVARGRANKEIAADLGLSVHTVERHLTNLFPKIGCRSRTEATAYAITHGIA